MEIGGIKLPADYLKIPERINVAAVTVDRQVAAGHGDRVAFYYEDQRITYRELQRRVNQCGNALLRLGIRRGDRFFIRAPNSPEYVIAVLAGFKIGAVPSPPTPSSAPGSWSTSSTTAARWPPSPRRRPRATRLHPQLATSPPIQKSVR